MEWSTVLQSLGELGVLGVLLGVMGYWFYTEMNKRDALQDARVDDLKEDIRVLRIENKEDKTLFRDSVDSFNRALGEFSSINNKIDNLEIDVSYIKKEVNNINK